MNHETSLCGDAIVLCLDFENGPRKSVVDEFECIGMRDHDEKECGEERSLNIFEVHDTIPERKKKSFPRHVHVGCGVRIFFLLGDHPRTPSAITIGITKHSADTPHPTYGLTIHVHAIVDAVIPRNHECIAFPFPGSMVSAMMLVPHK
jgi:hypothetical protein